ncbi:MAG: selenide, water dikinase SelD [Flavisolibacter sp.]|jgi:selenide,water dikinase|nr:selenide, water dikinase SelD [Flavisolibacter sp.]
MEESKRLSTYSKGGGCGCKISPAVLKEIIGSDNLSAYTGLLVGNDTNDDAAVFSLDAASAVISTTDFFLPIVDDAFDFGRIAAANAISDVYAMGGKPIMAIAILGWPVEKISPELARQVLEGGRSICNEAGIPLAGGHTIDSNDPIFGLSVTGILQKEHLKKNSAASAGDHLFLTKPLGVGILTTAIKRGVLAEEHYKPLIDQLTSLNKVGAALGKIKGVNAMTDVTGFGFLGHLIEMLDGGRISATIHYEKIKKIEGLDDYLRQRTIPDATFRNWNSYSQHVAFEKGVNVMEAFNVLPDPQTNGGLLIAVDKESLKEVAQIFQSFQLNLEPIGIFTGPREKLVYVTA